MAALPALCGSFAVASDIHDGGENGHRIDRMGAFPACSRQGRPDSSASNGMSLLAQQAAVVMKGDPRSKRASHFVLKRP
jgi:hypothetical protein